ncbi:MAG: S41 family peptidase [Chloroflexi bacterium]|nr:S41 family peptidase [Chloroflexota bacterium]MBV9602246.1 S41 family peptidase [Chloroflexota bacterium]
MKRIRIFLSLLVLACGLTAGGVVPSEVAAAAPVAMVPAATVEDAATQDQTFAGAYNLLLDHYVHSLDTAALLRAAWDNLSKEADGKAVAPGPSPTFVGDRAADLQSMRNALAAYLAMPNSSPDGFTAAYALIRGMVRFVDENHTYFLDPQQYHDYQSWSRGDNTYVGVGVSVSSRDSQPRIVEVYDGTPAQQAGLRAGDVLVSIDGQSVDGMALDEMTGLVRGPAGSSVQIVVRRGDDPEEIPYTVQRAEIHLQFVKDKLVQDDIGYLMLRGFPEPSVIDSIEQDIASFQTEGVHGLVLDLRGNSGGRIDVGTRLLGDFLPNGTSIYQEIDRNGHDSTHATHGSSQYEMPLVVLVDGGTASMGEIFASAVQEHGAATILGSNTSGSVAAAQVFGLPDGSALQVTVFDILAADGKPLNKVGVAPDEVIASDPSAVANGSDPVLTRAVSILQDEIAANSGA